MNNLENLYTTWKQAEENYKTAKTSLDGSIELIIAKEELSQARYAFDKACRQHVLETIFEKEEA